ncbi:MAG TPA: porin [Caulobacteraceae bacterium]|nr:porin [Caulobacteraceae bacterium]
MRTKMALLTGVALGAFLAAGTAAEAAPKAHKAHKAHAAAQRSAEATQAAEIEQLKAQVQSLSERLAATEQQQQQVREQAASAQAAAQAAQQQAANEVQTMPGVVNAEVARAVPKPRPSWADNTQISGRMYFDVTDLQQKRDGVKVAPTGVGFDIKRFYLGVDHKFNDVWSANLTTDVAYVSADGLTQVYVKKAYLQAKLSNALIVRLGSADQPWVPFAEDAYGYRFVENTLIDRTKFGTSADWGVHALGTLPGGIVSYAVSVVDGQGYKNPVRTKQMDIEGRVSAKLDDLTFAVGGYTGKLGKDVEGGVATPHTANRWDALAVYANKRFRIGAEYFAASNWNTVTSSASDKSDGYSLFGNVNFTPEISAFGRWDYVKPSKTLKDAEKDNYFNVGVNWEPVKVVDLALVYKRDKVDNGLFSTSNGTIGGVSQGTYDEVGLWGQFRW